MDAKTYLKISAINLLFLLIGVILGVTTVKYSGPVYAQDKSSAAKAGSATGKPPEDPNAEYVGPALTLSSPVVTNVFLANRIACDRLQVNSFDVMKLNDAILNLLVKHGIASPADIQDIVQAGKADRPLRLRPQ
jgi:hypothetical protein